ncbi:uncharacterized protein [Macrobrachium rosenbergii]|uniref:uncharacterized protein n=1 Tax=Macrobrachium rosenbergii TaxID=79674 RepID=UPI0034D67B78
MGSNNNEASRIGGGGSALARERTEGNKVVSTIHYAAAVGSHIDVAMKLSSSIARLREDVLSNFLERGIRSAMLYLCVIITSVRMLGDMNEKNAFYLCTPPILTTIDSIYDSLEEAIEFIANNLEERLNRTEGSGWCMTSLDRVELHITRRELVNINNFKAYPKGVRGSDQVINIQSGYNCVITALEAYVVLRDNPPTRINNLPRVLMRRMGRGQFNIKHSPDMPLTHDSFKTLEKGNNLNIYLYKLCELGMGNSGKNIGRYIWRGKVVTPKPSFGHVVINH